MPRRIVGGAFLSMDGVMQAPGGPEEDPTGGFSSGGWTFHYWDEVMGEAMGQIFGRPYELLLGRRTYDIFSGFWPYQPADDPIAGPFNATVKHVVTHNRAPLEWANSRRVGDDVPAELVRLKQQDGPDLVIQGSSTLYPLLLRHNLLDELFVMTFPVVLGKGKRLFGEGTPAGAFKLVDSKTATTGVQIASYRPAGEIVVGSFATQEPSAQELARRETMAAGSW
jgi:dihydrofolate reductase